MTTTQDTPTLAPTFTDTNWTSDHYPAALTQLAEPLRVHAIKVANSLKSSGLSPDDAIRRAVSAAWDWNRRGRPEMIDRKIPGPTWCIEHDGEHWVISSNDKSASDMRVNTYEQALNLGYKLAEEREGNLYAFVDGAMSFRYNYVDEPESATGIYHIAPTETGWVVNRTSATDSVYERHRTKKEALSAGREAARKNMALLMVHNAEGECLRQHDYRVS